MVQSLYHLNEKEIKDLTVKEFNRKCKNIQQVSSLYKPYMGGENSNEPPKRNLLGKPSGDLDRLVSSARKNKE